MNISSKPLAFIVFVIIFGGIGLSSALGFWQTTSTKEPATYTEGEFAGQANPADIRGSYTFGDIANSFDVTPEILAQAFQVTSNDLAAFAVKNLETMYADSGYEIGAQSVRLFVAYYLGLPFETTGLEIYMPKSATDILLAKNGLTFEQIMYLETYTVDVKPASTIDTSTPLGTGSEVIPTPEAVPTVKGKTTFGELVQWGVPQAAIEQIIRAPMPDPAMTVRDYATAKGLDFETLKTNLQKAVGAANQLEEK